MSQFDSKEVSRSALLMALSRDRVEESILKEQFLTSEIKAAAVDHGGEFIASANKIIERAIVAARREGLIKETHVEEGAIAGATHEALSQIASKAIGFNVGGKIGIARRGDHISVAVFFAIGMLHLNEVSVGMGHRAVP